MDVDSDDDMHDNNEEETKVTFIVELIPVVALDFIDSLMTL